MKFRPLRADEIECRIGQITDKGLMLLLYKDARCDMNLLDEVVGADMWKREHSVIDGKITCTVSIYNPELKEWVSKQDVGSESNTEAEKGVFSDSFKRACVNWGIGRELYSAPFVWVKATDCDINGRKCYDKFSVAKIAYDENKNIVGLAIQNDNKKKVVFIYDAKKKS